MNLLAMSLPSGVAWTWLAGDVDKQEAFLFMQKKNGLQTARHHHGFPCAVHKRCVGVATVDHFAGAIFAAPTLGGYTQVYLDIFKALPFTGVLVNFFVRDAMADANDHGGGRGKA